MWFHIRKLYLIILSASRADVDYSEVLVEFGENQQSATASIKIVDDDVVENIESFVVRLTLPSREVRENKLKYGDYQYAVVYIRDSKLVTE